MSKFFKALERAKKERLSQEEANHPGRPFAEVLSQPSSAPPRETAAPPPATGDGPAPEPAKAP